MLNFLKNDKLLENIYYINNFYKIMRNKRFFFNENTEKKFQNIFMSKKRETSNRMSELNSMPNYFKDPIIIPD